MTVYKCTQTLVPLLVLFGTIGFQKTRAAAVQKYLIKTLMFPDTLVGTLKWIINGKTHLQQGHISDGADVYIVYKIV